MKPTSRGSATVGSGSGIMAVTPSVGKGDTAPEGKRRSERVKREKPNFYDALEYDNQMRKVSVSIYCNKVFVSQLNVILDCSKRCVS